MIINKQDANRPFHAHVRDKNGIWKNIPIWLDLESGEDTDNSKLTHCIKFSYILDGKRVDIKLDNLETNKLFNKRFKYLIKLQETIINKIK